MTPTAVNPTPLQRRLARGEAHDATGPMDAFRLARRRFRAGERVDMTALAEDLGVNRVTLYRWVGTREQLLVEVVWSIGERALAAIEQRVRATGRERVVAAIAEFIDAVSADSGMRRWLEQEGDHALRLLTLAEPGFHLRLVVRIESFLQQTLGADAAALPAAPAEVANVLVDLIESYVHLGVLAGDAPGARRAEPVLRMLLR